MFPIHDLYVREMQSEPESSGERLRVVSYSDHLLRRFGFAEVVRLDQDHQRESTLRELADELWALIHGSVEFSLHDRRVGSPSSGQTYKFQTRGPTLLLVPFGVELLIQAVDGPAELIRLATHEESADG